MIDQRRNKAADLDEDMMKFVEAAEAEGYEITIIRSNISKTYMAIKTPSGFEMKKFEYDHNVRKPIRYFNGLFKRHVELTEEYESRQQ